MAEIGTVRRFPIAIRLNTMPRLESGKLARAEKVTMMDALLRTIVDIAWNQQADSCVSPIVRFRLEPNRVLCDLFARQEEVAKAAVWRNNQFNSQGFRTNVVKGLARAMLAWEQDKYGNAFVVDDRGIQVMDSQAASDVKPARI